MRYVTSIERLYKQEALEQGLKEGLEEGRQEGIQQGCARMLMILLVQRFGQPPEWVSKKLAEATPEVLESWSRRIFDARSLEDFFA